MDKQPISGMILGLSVGGLGQSHILTNGCLTARTSKKLVYTASTLRAKAYIPCKQNKCLFFVRAVRHS